jgi:transposase
MPRKYGYALRGVRCGGIHDWHAKGRVNAIGAIHNFTFITLSLFDTTVNSDVFFAWLTQDLLPKVPRNAVIIMDNARFHKRQDMIQAIHDQGIILEYLPPYSPDLNPIEHKWAQAKAFRRRYRCDVDELFSKHFNYDKL